MTKRAGSIVFAIVLAAGLLANAPGVAACAAETEQTVQIQEEADTDTVAVTDLSGLQSAIQNAADNQQTDLTVPVSGTITVDQPLVIPSGLSVTLCADPDASEAVLKKDSVTWSGTEGMLRVEGQAALTLRDIIIDGNQMEEGVRVEEGGTLDCQSGCIIQNASFRGYISQLTTSMGCGIANYGTCILDGAVIQNNKGSWAWGGGVYNAGSIEIRSGSITGNTCTTYPGDYSRTACGGGIRNEGTLTLYGGSIASNTAEKGGGVYNTGTFIMNGADALITKNTATTTRNIQTGNACGGGIYVAGGTFTLESGTLSYNKAWSQISASYAQSREDYPKLGGAWGCGGGIYIANRGAEVIMKGGSVESNRAYGNADPIGYSRKGGGIYVQGGTKQIEFYNPSGKDSQGDISGERSAGSLTVTGGTITKNYAQSCGSGIYAGSEEHIFYYNGTGSSNYGTWEGPVTLRMGGDVRITDNTGTQKDNLYLADGTQMQVCEPFSENAEIAMTAESGGSDTVIGVYESAGYVQETDPGHITVSGVRQAALGTVQAEGEEEQSWYLYLAAVSLEEGYVAEAETADFVYDGTEKKPAITVTGPDGETLTSGIDYSVTYENNIKAGTAAAIVQGQNDYSGTIRIDFEIEPKSLNSEDIVFTSNELTEGTLSYPYTGSQIRPSAGLISIRDEGLGINLRRNTDFAVSYGENTNAGIGTVIVTGIGNYGESVEKTFEIKAENEPAPATDKNNTDTDTGTTTVTTSPKAVTPAVTLSATSYTYNGKVKKPAVTVKADGKTLAKSDYAVSYASGRKSVGTYKVTVRLKGNYSGSKTVSFKINPKNTSITRLTAGKKAVTVKWKKLTAKMSTSRITGYQIQVATNAKFTANKKTVTVKGYKKTSKKITKLKSGKKYYVRIRTYKKVGGKTYYSGWTKAKKVKIVY